MKSQLRNITVDGYAFVYWYSGESRFILNLSPKENKNIKITLIFQANPPEEESHTFWSFYDISAQNIEMETVIHLGKPKHIAEIISYLMAKRQELWVQGKPHVLDNAWDLLKEMGYSELKPIWIRQW
ncbi:hypothetical protein NLX78_05195 [Paenibacillus sp. Lou8.1]|uniref:hypothetical protein n=1 Tax=Paenibacillus sp. Lou8.1 TaxID=2962041 RepID=UPI0020B65DA4|nr:hypothetical protein [Paenibacillus sp. Lou8.1]MCP3806619.1 hypothetical protein [Paenibacillus sp. Lou8.1]